jgi:hypothetical protein
MSIALIQERLAAYACTSTIEEDRAIREITVPKRRQAA